MNAGRQGVRAGGAYVEITADASKLYKTLDDSEKKLKDFSDSASELSGALAGVGAAIAAPAALGVKAFAEFEERMLTVKGVTGAAGDALAKLTATAQELGATTSWSASQVADGMIALGRMGFDPSQINASIRSVMDMARGLGVTVDEAAGMLGATLNQFGADASRSAEFADILTKATNAAAISATELGESLKYSGAAGAAVGQSIEEVVALTMSLRNVGLDASQAGTSLRSMFLTLQDAKKASAFEELFKVSLRDDEGRLRSLVDVFTDAQAAAQAMGDEVAGVVKEIFGTEATTAAVSLLSASDMRDNEELLRNAQGAAAALREEMESGVAGSFDAVKSAVEGASIALGEALAPEVKGLAEAIVTISGALATFIKENEGLVKTLGKNAVGLLAVGATFTALSAAAKTGAGIANAAKSAWSSLATAWAAAGQSSKTTAAAVDGAGAAMNRTTKNVKGTDRALQALRFTAAGVKKALQGLFVTTAIMAGWQLVLSVFQAIASFATKTADEMERARKANEERVSGMTNAVDSMKDKIAQDEGRVDDVLNRAMRSNMTEQQKAALESDIKSLIDEGILQDGEILRDATTASGFRVKDAAVEYRAKQRARELAIGEGANAFSDVSFNPEDYKLAAVDKRIKADEVDLQAYQQIYDVFSAMSEGSRKGFAEAYTGAVTSTAFNYKTGAYGEKEDLTGALALMYDDRTKKVLDEIMEASKSYKWGSPTVDVSEFERFLNDVKAVQTAQKEYQDFRDDKSHSYEADIEANQGKEFESEEMRAARELREEQFRIDAQAAADEAKAAGDAAARAAFEETTTAAERKRDELTTQRAELQKRFEDLQEQGDLTPEQVESFKSALESLDAAIAAAADEVAQETKERERRAAEEAAAFREEMQHTSLDALDESIDLLRERMTAGRDSFDEALLAVQGGLVSAETVGADTTEREEQIRSIVEAFGATIAPKLDGVATLNSFEALDMNMRDDSAILREQRDYLREMASRLDELLKTLQDDDGEFI